jgi:hypothetical protein
MAGGNNAIGTGAVVLTTTADGLASGLAKAQGDLQHFGQTAGAGLSKSMASAAGGSGGGVGGMLSGLMGAAKAHPFVAAGVAAGAGLVAGFETATKKLDAFGKTNKRADVLGVGASDLMGMDKLFAKVGVEADAVNGILAKMGKNILTSHGAAETLASIGIAPKDIKDKSLTDQFKMIADGINKLPKGAEQAAAAMTLFGKSGAALLPMLQRGSGGINEFIENQKRFGGVLSDSQLKAAGDASKAWKLAKESISTAWEGLINRVVVIAAPIVKFVADAVSKGFALLAPMFDWIGRAVGAVAEIATVVFDVMGKAVEEVIGLFRAWGKHIGVIGEKFPSIRDVVVESFRFIGMAGGHAWDVIAKGMGIVAQGIGLIVEGLGKVVEQFNKLLVATGFDPILVKTTEIGESIGEWGEKMAGRRFGQSADDFSAWLDNALKKKEVKAKAAAGPLATGMEADAAVWNPGKFAGAIERGSKEAYSIEMRARYGSFGAPDNTIPKDHLKATEKGNAKLDDILKRLESIENHAEEL